MHSFMHGHNKGTHAGSTQGFVLNWGWRYDLMLWFGNLMARGKWREAQRKAVDLARFQSGETVLDVGCGTGTLTLEACARVGSTGRVSGIDPGPKQIARARQKAARRGLPIDFQVGVIERLPFPAKSFDAVLSTLMMHVLPDDLKRQGLSEIARVLKPGGRLLVVDTMRPAKEQGNSEQLVHIGPFNSGVQDQPRLMKEAGFSQIESGEITTGARWIPGMGFALGRISK